MTKVAERPHSRRMGDICTQAMEVVRPGLRSKTPEFTGEMLAVPMWSPGAAAISAIDTIVGNQNLQDCGGGQPLLTGEGCGLMSLAAAIVIM